jgi:hypothetical protein
MGCSSSEICGFPPSARPGCRSPCSEVDTEAAGDRVPVHAAPPELDVIVRDKTGKVIAEGRGLERGQLDAMTAHDFSAHD